VKHSSRNGSFFNALDEPSRLCEEGGKLVEERKMVIIVSDQIHFMYLIGYIPPPWFIAISTNGTVE